MGRFEQVDVQERHGRTCCRADTRVGSVVAVLPPAGDARTRRLTEQSLNPWVRRSAAALLRASAVNHAMRLLARARGHRLVLVYHRVGDAVAPGCEIIPSVPLDLFRAQLQALGEVATFVTLTDVLTRGGREQGAVADAGRPAVALTFDDDLPSHTAIVLPVLREFGVPAAFFLSGRALHGRANPRRVRGYLREALMLPSMRLPIVKP